jgi:hypothetical protein
MGENAWFRPESDDERMANNQADVQYQNLSIGSIISSSILLFDMPMNYARPRFCRFHLLKSEREHDKIQLVMLKETVTGPLMVISMRLPSWIAGWGGTFAPE